MVVEPQIWAIIAGLIIAVWGLVMLRISKGEIAFATHLEASEKRDTILTTLVERYHDSLAIVDASMLLVINNNHNELLTLKGSVNSPEEMRDRRDRLILVETQQKILWSTFELRLAGELHHPNIINAIPDRLLDKLIEKTITSQELNQLSDLMEERVVTMEDIPMDERNAAQALIQMLAVHARWEPDAGVAQCNED